MIQRHLEPLILNSLKHFPVVLVTGARQVGKSTLVQSICQTKWKAAYLTLDDRSTLDAALTDPDGLIASRPGPLAIDEIQRAPDLLRAIKLQVDRRRKPGRFLLTGSANVITLKSVSETLAGRVVLHELHPFSLSELQRAAHPPRIVHRLFQSKDPRLVFREIGQTASRPARTLPAHILHGGYPDPALFTKAPLRTQWFEAYRKTYIERDVREVQAIERLTDFGRLMMLAASRTGQVLNCADLGRDAGLPYVTLRRYLNVLEQTYQILLVPPYFANVSKRMMKAPKLYWSDTGLASHLLDARDPRTLQQHPKWGALVETWVAQELQKLISLAPEPTRLYGWRLRTGQEIDFLLERNRRILAIETKWGRRIERSTLDAFQTLKGQLGEQFACGVVLYGGEEVIPLGPQLVAIPHQVFFGSQQPT